MRMRMALKTMLYLMVLSSLLCNHEIEAYKSQKFEWERQFQLLQKSSVKTIKTEYGDIYDCIDFYKQPAFDHPLLKNHTFYPQMRPSNFIPNLKKNNYSQGNKRPTGINAKLKGGSCPRGTVPIRRFTKDEFFQTMEFTQNYASTINKPNAVQPQSGQNFALIQTKGPVSYNGIGGDLSAYNLSIGTSQYSTAELIVQNGDDRIQVGWTINQNLNHDSQTRLFQYFNAGESHCFNMVCPGFVGVSHETPIDLVVSPVSTIGHTIYVLTIYIYKEPSDGNWWLVIEYDGKKRAVGFWPQQLFMGLKNAASWVAVGGETYSPPGQSVPLMGSGHYPRDPFLAEMIGYCEQLYVVDEDHRMVQPQDTEPFVTNSVYGVVDKGLIPSYGRLIFYGGGL